MKNVGSIDRGVRLVIALGLFSILFLLQGGSRWLGLLGFVPLLTGTFGMCPLYSIFGMNTYPKSGKK